MRAGPLVARNAQKQEASHGQATQVQCFEQADPAACPQVARLGEGGPWDVVREQGDRELLAAEVVVRQLRNRQTQQQPEELRSRLALGPSRLLPPLRTGLHDTHTESRD